MFGIRENIYAKNTQFLIDSIGEGILIVNKKGIITTTNTAAEKLLGYLPKEYIGWFCLEPFGALNETGHIITKKNAALYAAIKNGKKTINATRQFLKKDGVHFWASITVTPMIKNRKTDGAIIVFRDITQDKLNKEYHTDFARVASHQLRTPLGNVLWSTEYILSEKPGELNKLQREAMEQSYHTLREMNTLVNDLLNVSRLQDHEVRAKPKKVLLKEVVERVIKNISPFISATNLTIDIDAGKSNQYVYIEPHHLRTIIQNIIENAVRYPFPKTTIHIVIKKEKKHILFTCTNKGIGIDEKSKKFIFAKFFRAKNAVRKIGDGTGLGMYITHELIRLYGGKIWFESEVNKQTTFFLLFKR